MRSRVPLSIVRSRWTILGLLVLATAINVMDRQLPFIMAEPIRREFGLSDTQLGLLGGAAFSVVYALGALPLARFADCHSRKWVLAGCLATWSIFTALGAAAINFTQLSLTRAGVAIGEAGSGPASHSMISDLFAGSRRGLAMAWVTCGMFIGIFLGMAVGGVMLDYLPWRNVLLLAAIPGIALAFIFAVFVNEPTRVGRDLQLQHATFGAAVLTLWNQPAYVRLTIAAALTNFATSAGTTFGPSFLIRSHGLTISEAGIVFGLMLGLGGVAGGLASGALFDRLSTRDVRWMLWIPGVGQAIQAPLFCASWIIEDVRLAVGLQFMGYIVGGSYLALSYATAQVIAAPRVRALASAIIQISINIVGNVMGPLCAGSISDQLRPALGQGGALGVALAICGMSLVLSSFVFLRAAAHLPDAVGNLEQRHQYQIAGESEVIAP